MNTVVLWFLVFTNGGIGVVFPHQFATQSKCEQAKFELRDLKARCFSAEVISNK